MCLDGPGWEQCRTSVIRSVTSTRGPGSGGETREKTCFLVTMGWKKMNRLIANAPGGPCSRPEVEYADPSPLSCILYSVRCTEYGVHDYLVDEPDALGLRVYWSCK